MSTAADYHRELAEAADQFGYTVADTRGGHIKLVPLGGGPPIFCSSTPSDWRAIKNTRAHMRRDALKRGYAPDSLAERTKAGLKRFMDDAMAAKEHPLAAAQREFERRERLAKEHPTPLPMTKPTIPVERVALPEATLTVQRGIPLPQKKPKRKWTKYPWDQMKPGDSFFLPRVGDKRGGLSFIGARRKQKPEEQYEHHYVTENGKEGVRIWRMK